MYYSLKAKEHVQKMKKKKNSIFLCSPKKVEGTNALPMIKFKRLKDSLDLKKYDSLIFTSKQAVIFTDEINKEWKSKKILAVGKATANLAQKLGAKNIYYPKEFYGESLANDIVKNFKNLKMLYLRPKVISFDSKSFLKKNGIDIEEEILYETRCIEYKNKELPKNSIIIFTSPSTIDCFFKSFNWDNSYKAIVIGKSTLNNLPKYIKAYVADEPTIDSCVEKAKEISYLNL